MNLNIFILESALLFIFVVHAFRTFQITNLFAILLTALLLLGFFASSIFPRKMPNFGKIRLFLLISILLTVYSFLLIQEVDSRVNAQNSKNVHDGVIITEFSYRFLISGLNPYSLDFGNVLNHEKYDGDVPLRATVNYPYSPMMFLVGVPIYLITDNFFNTIDMRITLVIFLFLTAFLGALMVREKILFLIIFLLNPLFIPLLFYGANDIVILFFLFLSLYFLYLRRELWATVMLGLATGTKLLILPLAPLYFLYLFMSFKKKKTEKFIFNIAIFIFVNLVIYLPFLIWNPRDLIGDLLSPWIGNSVYAHPIAGFLGVGQILSKLGLVSADSSFPFFIFAIPFELCFLALAFKVFKESKHILTLSVFMAANLILLLSFSRLLQTYYLAFVFQILLFASFVNPFF